MPHVKLKYFIMDKIKKLLTFLAPLPLWLRVIVVGVVSALVSLCVLMSASSCGTTRAVVHNGASGTSTEIRITTNNPTSVTASPNVELKHSPDE